MKTPVIFLSLLVCLSIFESNSYSADGPMDVSPETKAQNVLYLRNNWALELAFKEDGIPFAKRIHQEGFEALIYDPKYDKQARALAKKYPTKSPETHEEFIHDLLGTFKTIPSRVSPSDEAKSMETITFANNNPFCKVEDRAIELLRPVTDMIKQDSIFHPKTVDWLAKAKFGTRAVLKSQ